MKEGQLRDQVASRLGMNVNKMERGRWRPTPMQPHYSPCRIERSSGSCSRAGRGVSVSVLSDCDWSFLNLNDV